MGTDRAHLCKVGCPGTNNKLALPRYLDKEPCLGLWRRPQQQKPDRPRGREGGREKAGSRDRRPIGQGKRGHPLSVAGEDLPSPGPCLYHGDASGSSFQPHPHVHTPHFPRVNRVRAKSRARAAAGLPPLAGAGSSGSGSLACFFNAVLFQIKGRPGIQGSPTPSSRLCNSEAWGSQWPCGCWKYEKHNIFFF